jgi:hypothetical protein
MATESYQPEILRNQAWQVIGNIGTVEALEILIKNLMSSWGHHPPVYSANSRFVVSSSGGQTFIDYR